MLTAKILITKGRDKDTIYRSTSTDRKSGAFSHYNFAGKLTELENYNTGDGKNVTDQLVAADVSTTIMVHNQALGDAIFEKACEIFEDREAEGDGNPAIELIVEAKTLRVPGNIIIKRVSKAYINSDAELPEFADNILANLKAQEKVRAQRPNIMTAVRRGAPKPNQKPQHKLSRFVKQYF